MRTLAERFWEKVVRTDYCWFWVASHDLQGYGTVWDGEAVRLAHRVAWLLTTGKYPRRMLLHGCDNPVCVRPHPEHCHEGDQALNMQEMMARRRGNKARGTRQGCAKLTRSAVASVRKEYGLPGTRWARRGQVTLRALAAEYDVSTHTIWAVIHRVTWK